MPDPIEEPAEDVQEHQEEVAEESEEVRDPAALLKAYEAEKTKRRELAQRLREQEEAARPENPVDPDEIRAEATREANARVAERIVRTEVKAAAKGRVVDVDAALALMDLSQFSVEDDGSVNESDIDDAVKELLEKKPYLAAQSRRFQDSADGGGRKDSPERKPGLNDLFRAAINQ